MSDSDFLFVLHFKSLKMTLQVFIINIFCFIYKVVAKFTNFSSTWSFNEHIFELSFCWVCLFLYLFCSQQLTVVKIECFTSFYFLKLTKFKPNRLLGIYIYTTCILNSFPPLHLKLCMVSMKYLHGSSKLKLEHLLDSNGT